jgi:hypothetical protein
MCSHITAAAAASKPHPKKGTPDFVCVDCVKEGSRWVHLRTCQECGDTHCCDASPKRHATAHNKATGHPVIQSAEPGEGWFWCYPDEAFRA